MVPPDARESSKVTVYSPTVAPPEALSVIVMVQVFEAGGAAGTVGAKETLMLCDVPRLSKYSTESVRAAPSAPALVSVPGRLTPSEMRVVGSDVNWFTLTRTGCRPAPVSRGKLGIVPSAFAGQPRSVTPVDVRK